MFFRRLYLMLAIVVALTGMVIARLVQIQVFDAAQYSDQADEQLARPLKIIPPIRGSILTRHGQLLVNNEPAWQVCVDYKALAATADSDWVKKQAQLSRVLRTRSPDSPNSAPSAAITLTPIQARQEVLDRVEAMLVRIAGATHTPLARIQEERSQIVARVQAIKQEVSAAKKRPMQIELESIAHPVVSDLSREEAMRLRDELHDLPWCRVEATEKRVFHQTAVFAHLLGRTGPVSPQVIQNDPNAGDRRLQYRPDERVGLSGVELLADAKLRGLAGYRLETRDKIVQDEVPPVDGENVRLTLDERLQSAIYQDLGLYLKSLPSPQFALGAAVVVLDVPSRELLALVSYPSYDPARFSEDYPALRSDLLHRPLLDRSVQGQYPPGSIIKPMVIASAISAGVIVPGTPFTCQGYLNSSKPSEFRCWISKFHTGHGTLTAEEALKYSCNVYLYNVGMAMGTPRLTEWFDRFGLGHPAGVGLLDESRGVNPTPEWLQRVRHRAATPADCRNFAIGQGEITVSPLQAANMIAEVITGVSKPPTVIQNDSRPRLQSSLGLTKAAIETARRGMYRVVNDSSGPWPGTAYKYARMEELDIGGKTGTAQASRLRLGPGNHYPPQEASKHAWFAGFAPAGSRDAPRIVVCVFIEYGGGGGQTAGPLAKVVFSRLIALGYLSAKPGHIPKPPENYLSGAAATATEPIFSPGAIPPPQDETMTEPVATQPEEE